VKAYKDVFVKPVSDSKEKSSDRVQNRHAGREHHRHENNSQNDIVSELDQELIARIHFLIVFLSFLSCFPVVKTMAASVTTPTAHSKHFHNPVTKIC
jgi:hypothetical protein